MADEDGPSRALMSLLRPLCSDAWVQCDSCALWRRVPKEVSERLGDDDQWCARELAIARARAPSLATSRDLERPDLTPPPPSSPPLNPPSPGSAA